MVAKLYIKATGETIYGNEIYDTKTTTTTYTVGNTTYTADEVQVIPMHPFELFGVECDKGWNDLIRPVADYLMEYNKDKPEEEQMRFLQIKEKWGLLDIELNFFDKKMSELVEQASEDSYNVCETCGSREKVGTVESGWITTTCLDCARKMSKKSDSVLMWQDHSNQKHYWVEGDKPLVEIPDDDMEELP